MTGGASDNDDEILADEVRPMEVLEMLLGQVGDVVSDAELRLADHVVSERCVEDRLVKVLELVTTDIENLAVDQLLLGFDLIGVKTRRGHRLKEEAERSGDVLGQDVDREAYELAAGNSLNM